MYFCVKGYMVKSRHISSKLESFRSYQANLVLRYSAKSITFQENAEDDKWRKYLPIGLLKVVQYSV